MDISSVLTQSTCSCCKLRHSPIPVEVGAASGRVRRNAVKNIVAANGRLAILIVMVCACSSLYSAPTLTGRRIKYSAKTQLFGLDQVRYLTLKSSSAAKIAYGMKPEYWESFS